MASAVGCLSFALPSRSRSAGGGCWCTGPRLPFVIRTADAPRHRQRRVNVMPNNSGGNESEAVEESPSEELPIVQYEKERSALGEFFGTYLQLGVWVLVLSIAGYTGFQKLQTDPDSVGILLAPPALALLLIVSFLFYRFTTGRKQ